MAKTTGIVVTDIEDQLELPDEVHNLEALRTFNIRNLSEISNVDDLNVLQ